MNHEPHILSVLLKRTNRTLLRRYAIILVLITLALLVAPVSRTAAGLDVWSPLGPLPIDGQGNQPSVVALVVDPQNPQTLYAGSAFSSSNTTLIYKSVNGGLNWSAASNDLPASGPSGTGINALAINPQQPGTLLAGIFNNGVWRSTNGGANWSAASSGSIAPNDNVGALVVNPQNPAIVYAIAGGTVHRSTNGGVSWSLANGGLPGSTSALFNALVIDPQSPDTLYVATTPAAIYKTTNGGTLWSRVDTGLPGTSIGAVLLAINPAAPTTLYTRITGIGGGLYRSTNGGVNWTLLFNDEVSVLAVHPQNPNILYARLAANGSTPYAVLRSEDGGVTWGNYSGGLADVAQVIVFNPGSPDQVFAGTSIAGVFSLRRPKAKVHLSLVVR